MVEKESKGKKEKEGDDAALKIEEVIINKTVER